MSRALILAAPMLMGIAAVVTNRAIHLGELARADGATPDLDQVMAGARKQLEALNATVDGAIAILTTANSTGCEMLTQTSGLDALAPLFDQMNKAAEAVAMLPFSSTSADDAKATVAAFVDSMAARIEASDASLADGCSKLSAALAPLISKLMGALELVYVKYNTVEDKAHTYEPTALASRSVDGVHGATVTMKASHDKRAMHDAHGFHFKDAHSLIQIGNTEIAPMVVREHSTTAHGGKELLLGSQEPSEQRSVVHLQGFVVSEDESGFHAAVWACITLFGPCMLFIAGLYFGGPPPVPDAVAKAGPKEPPFLITLFSGVVCVGVMANVTVILPQATEQSEEAGGGVLYSGYLISAYCIGAIVSVPFFGTLTVDSLRTAYLIHGTCMMVGNFGFALAGELGYHWIQLTSRIVCGFEGGCMFNTALAFAYFAKGSALTSYMVLYQFFIACGVLLGPVLAAISISLCDLFSFNDSLFVVNGCMAIWGLCVILALLLFWPKNYDQLVQEWADSPRGSSSANDAKESPEAVRQGMALVAIMLNCAFLRLLQRLVWESGAIYLIADKWNWGASTSGYLVGAVGIVHTTTQLVVAQRFAGKYSDERLMHVLEILQVVGIMLMFNYDARDETHLLFFLGSATAYCANSVWGGICTSYCLKRSVDGSSYDRRRLILINQVAIFCGIACGGIVSRAMLAYDPDQNTLACILLPGAVFQTMLTGYIIVPGMSVDMNRAVSLLTAGIIAVGVLVKSMGGTGADNVFSWHIAAMGLAWPGLAYLGTTVYHDTQKLTLTEKNPQRSVHMICMILVTLLSIAGYIFIYKAHADNGEGQTGGLEWEEKGFKLDRSVARFIHVVVGYLVLVGAAVQVPAGLLKRMKILSTGERIATWHGKFGRVLTTSGIIASLIGVWIHWNDDGGWSDALKVVLTMGLVLIGIDTFLPLITTPLPVHKMT